MRSFLVILPVLTLAACAPEVPDSAAGVGFDDYSTYLRENSTPAPVPVAPIVPPGTPATGFSTDAAAAAIDAASGVSAAPLDGTAPLPSATAGLDPAATTAARPRGDAPATIQSESGEVAFVAGTVSDEQDFAAVSSRETIESDAARIAANRAQYVVIQPEALPTRPGDVGPNIVEYALATTNPPGVQLYNRSSLALTNHEKACAKFTSSDLAQEAFLANGGPEKDGKNLDPDGDGFACAWDPRPFRAVLQ